LVHVAALVRTFITTHTPAYPQYPCSRYRHIASHSRLGSYTSATSATSTTTVISPSSTTFSVMAKFFYAWSSWLSQCYDFSSGSTLPSAVEQTF
jgi:hypothetical protein